MIREPAKRTLVSARGLTASGLEFRASGFVESGCGGALRLLGFIGFKL